MVISDTPRKQSVNNLESLLYANVVPVRAEDFSRRHELETLSVPSEGPDLEARGFGHERLPVEQGPVVNLDLAELSLETRRGRDMSYAMLLAREPATWRTIHRKLRSTSTQGSVPVSLAEAEPEIIIDFCKVAFAHGADIQNLAVRNGIHLDLISSLSIDPVRTWAALSNLITKNTETIEIVHQAVLASKEVTEMSCQDTPTMMLMFLRNSVSNKGYVGHQGICARTVRSNLFFNLVSTLEPGELPIADTDNDLRRSLSSAILSTMFDAGLLRDCLDRVRGGTVDSKISLPLQLSIYRGLSDHAQQTEGQTSTAIFVTVISELKSHLETLLEMLPTTIEIGQVDLRAQEFSWIAAGELLKTLAESCADPYCGMAQNSQALNCLGAVLVALSLADRHIPQLKAGRGTIEKNCLVLPNFKKHCIMIVSNMAHHNRIVQDFVRKTGCLPLILAQSHIDDMNPFLREHATFCIRNLLDDNADNQQLVNSLKPVALQNDNELSKFGYSAELIDGKVVVNKDQQKDFKIVSTS